MIGLNYEDIVEKITEVTGRSQDEIKSRVKEKLTKLSGLISTEGAAHIVANELGVDLLEIIRKKGLKISKVAPGMRGICVVGKVIKIYETRSYKRENKEGKVGSLLIGDETGVIRLVLWDTNQIKMIEDSVIKDNVILKVTDGHIRDNSGFKELHLSNRSEITVNPEGILIDNVASPMAREAAYQRKEIKNLQPGEFASVIGTIVQIYEPKFYDACPECGKKMTGPCVEHGDVQPKPTPILNFYLDDGTGSIRTVAFRDNVTSILAVDEQRLLAIRTNPTSFEEMRSSTLGKQLMISGRINKNDMFQRLEMNVNRISEIDPATIANSLLKETQ